MCRISDKQLPRERAHFVGAGLLAMAADQSNVDGA
jgi:hypothetical protein